MQREGLGGKIKILRKQNNMSQDDLAGKLNVTRQAVSNWERNVTLPDINTIDRISDIFSISIDDIVSGDTERIEKQYNRKTIISLYIVSILLILGNMIVSYFIYGYIRASSVFPALNMVFMQTIIIFTFGYAVKNEDYTMIAGFDSKADYNIITLKKILHSIENHTMISSLIFICIFISLGYIDTSYDIGGILLTIFIIEFITSIMIINIRNQDKLFNKKEDLLMARSMNRIALVFIAGIGMLLLTTMYTFQRYNIENNSTEAMKMLGIMIPYLILSLAGMFIEQGRIRQAFKSEDSYKPSKISYINIVISLLLLVLMIWVAERL